jgi:antitoxin component of MazEF toxin-antitoxin module
MKSSIVLTADEWRQLHQLLLNPPKPNRRLRKAFAEHARGVLLDGITPENVHSAIDWGKPRGREVW